MSFGKMNTFIDIVETRKVKDSEGFTSTEDVILASVRAYREGRHGSERWANLAAFSEATDLFRFPGGSTAYKSRVKTLVRDAGYAWFDWNTMTGDAQYTFSSDQEMLDYTLRQTEGKDVIILLMHEGKARTRRILPELVAYFREAGYEFRALSTSEEDRGILSRCGAHMMLPDAAQE